jgi:predicted lipoprotein
MPATQSTDRKALRKRTKISRLVWIAIVVLILIYCIVKPPFVIVPIKTATSAAAPASSGIALVDSIWEQKVVPKIVNDAIDADVLIPAIRGNSEEAGQKYGRRDATNPFNYLIKGTGTITEIRTESRAGTVVIRLEGKVVNDSILLQVGPVIPGTAIRDATGLVNFNQFTSQIDFADVSREMNALSRKSAFGNLDPTSLKDKKVRFWGAFTYHPGGQSEISVTPVKVEVLQ